MTSTEALRVCAVLPKSRTLSSPDHVHPKPLTPFSIVDILSKPTIQRSHVHRSLSREMSWSVRVQERSALSALQELTNKTFRALDINTAQTPAGRGRDEPAVFVPKNQLRKRRKARTAFTSQQLCELEKRFLYQRYLSPADRDHIAQQLGLTNAQVITWFQNRRAKLKRDLEEMKADVESAKALGNVSTLIEPRRSGQGTRGVSGPGATSQRDHGQKLVHKLQLSPAGSHSDHTSQHSSEEDEGDMEIDVDD